MPRLSVCRRGSPPRRSPAASARTRSLGTSHCPKRSDGTAQRPVGGFGHRARLVAALARRTAAGALLALAALLAAPMLGIGGIAHAQTEVPTDWSLIPAAWPRRPVPADLRQLDDAQRSIQRHHGLRHACAERRRIGPCGYPNLQRAVQGAWEHRDSECPRSHRDHLEQLRRGFAHLLAERRQRRRRL